MKSYSVEVFGCRASAADGDGIAEGLDELGLRAADSWHKAEVVVVQTCAVTAAAERQARALIRRVKRENPEAKVVVTGCYAQRMPGELAGLPGVDAVVGNSHARMAARVAASMVGVEAGRMEAPLAPRLPTGTGFVSVEAIGRAKQNNDAIELFAQSADKERETGDDITSGTRVWHETFRNCSEAAAKLPPPGSRQRTRPVLKVQDGCGNRCSFCVIPETRGPSRSVSVREAVEAARRFAEGGGAEMVLSGINLGRWGAELKPRRTLAELVRALLEETGLPRLRVSSVEPMDWVPELMALWERYGTGEHPRLAPHAHLPLQSGADAVLRAMHRRYRPWHYAANVRELRARLPEAALGADVMVGFPGETEALFEESYRFTAELPLTYLHLFPFSIRPGTRAAGMSGQVRPEVKRERMKRMQALDLQKRQAFAEQFIERELSAVTLRDGTALTGNFLAVHVEESLRTGQEKRDCYGLPDESSFASRGSNRLLTVRIASIRRAENGAVTLQGVVAGKG